MGHAGAIVSGSQGTAAAKAEALEAKGVRVGRTPTEVAELAAELLGAGSPKIGPAHTDVLRSMQGPTPKPVPPLTAAARDRA